MFILIILFLINFSILGNGFSGDIPYNDPHPFITNPASSTFSNDFQLGYQYRKDGDMMDLFFGGDTPILSTYFGGGFDIEFENRYFFTNLSTNLGKYLGFGYTYTKYENSSSNYLGVMIGGDGYIYGSIDLSDSDNYQFGLTFRPIKNISLNFDMFHTLDNWRYRGGISLHNFYGFNLSYQYSYSDEKSTHFITTMLDFPYFSVYGTTYHDQFNSAGLVFHSRRKKDSFFNQESLYLHIQIDQPLSEIGTGGVLTGYKYTFLDLLVAIDKGIKDPNIKGFLVELDGSVLSLSQTEELIKLFKKRDKKQKLIIYLNRGKMAEYLLATSADRIVSNPVSELQIQGPFFVSLFYQKLLSFIGIKTYFFKRSEYKTAPETYTNSAPSKYYLEELKLIKKTLSKWIKDKILKSRKMVGIDYLLDRAPYPAFRAKNLGFVDDTLYLDQLKKEIKEKGFSLIRPRDHFLKYYRDSYIVTLPRVAVLSIDGVISEMGQSSGMFGSPISSRKQLIKMIQHLRKDSSVKGVIVRVNSPGGSGFVSDAIHRELTLLKKVKKVYISMAGVAASGGYYVAVAGDKIFANEMTVTGSIGVYSGQIVIKDLLKKILISVFSSTLWENGSLFSPFKHPSKDQIDKMEELVESFYQIFLNKVKEGRNFSKEKVEKVAKGQIYLGDRAKELGLVDHIGGFIPTLDMMKKELKLDKVTIITYPRDNNFFTKLIFDEKNLFSGVKSWFNLIQSPFLLLSDLYIIE